MTSVLCNAHPPQLGEQFPQPWNVSQQINRRVRRVCSVKVNLNNRSTLNAKTALADIAVGMPTQAGKNLSV